MPNEHEKGFIALFNYIIRIPKPIFKSDKLKRIITPFTSAAVDFSVAVLRAAVDPRAGEILAFVVAKTLVAVHSEFYSRQAGLRSLRLKNIRY